MKTFKHFLEEATSRQFHSSKDSLLQAHGGAMPSGYRASYRPGKGWFAYSNEDEKASKQRREENIKVSTGQQTQREKDKVARKMQLRTERGKDVHHAADVKTSGDIMRHMSPGDRLEFKKRMGKHHIYLGNDPRNLILANRGSASEFNPLHPGFHHKAFHEFESEHGEAIRGLPMTKMRAFTTLVNQARRRKRKLPELQARMAKAAERHGIKND